MLADPALLAQRLSIATGVPDFDEALRAAVRAGSATTLAKARYPQPHEYSGVTDYFYTTSDADPLVTLRLSKGFLSSVNSAWSGPTLAAVKAGALGDGVKDLTNTDVATLLIDGERAFITIADCAPRKWLAVTHSGGLQENSAGVYEGVPDAMREYALAMSGLALQSHKSLAKEDFAAVDSMVRSAGHLLGEFTRAKPGAFLPIGTELA